MLASDSPQRILSLLPGATETVYALGAGSRLVGVSHECDHPEAALKKPRVTRTRIDSRGASREIDATVKNVKGSGESLYELDAALLRRLKPDLIFTQIHCDVCAITPDDLDAAIEHLDETPKILALEGADLDGVLRDMRRVADALGLREEGKLLLFRQWRILKEIRANVQELEPVRAAILDWIDPLMFAGNWIPDLARIAGANATLGESGKPSRWGSWDEVEEFAPDAIVVAPCGRGVDDSLAELGPAVRGRLPSTIPAVATERVFVADGHHYFNRSGPRLVYTAALLARTFHPGLPPLPRTLEAMLRPFHE